MIIHIVLFKFKEENKQANMQEAKTMLEELARSVPTLDSIEVGINFCMQERAMDMSIITQFEDKDGFDAYVVHPEHQEVVAFIKEVTEYSKVVDYEAL